MNSPIIQLIPDVLRLPLALTLVAAVLMLVIAMFLARRRAAAEVVRSLESCGWRNFRSTLWTVAAGNAWHAEIEARRVKVLFGVQRKGDPVTLRVTFATHFEDSFEVRMNLNESGNIFTRPLFVAPATPILGGTLQMRGHMSQGLTSSDKVLDSCGAAIKTRHDFVRLRRRKVVISLALPIKSDEGASIAFRLRPPVEQIEARVKAIDHVARSLISAGV